jgi:hypothetical protein
VAKKTQRELEAIKRAFSKKGSHQHAGVKTGGGDFVMTPAQRRSFELKKKQAEARVAAIG